MLKGVLNKRYISKFEYLSVESMREESLILSILLSAGNASILKKVQEVLIKPFQTSPSTPTH